MQIRVAEERDAAALAEIYSYYVEKTAITFEYETPSTEEFTERIHNIKEKYPYIVAEENGEILGYATSFSSLGMMIASIANLIKK